MIDRDQLWEEIVARCYVLRDYLSRVSNLLFVVVPIILGAIAGDIEADIHKDQLAQQEFFHSFCKSTRNHWEIFPVIFVWYLSYLGTQDVQQRNVDKRVIYRQLKHILGSLNAHICDQKKVLTPEERQRLLNDLDIRCTLWFPLGTQEKKLPSGQTRSQMPTHLRQWVDYCPPGSFIQKRGQASAEGEDGVRDNARAGRTVRVYRRINGEKKGIGILGLATLRAWKLEESLVFTDKVEATESLRDHLVGKRNVTAAAAERVTQDRLSFMCCPLVNEGSKKLLCIVYFDSRSRELFEDPALNLKIEVQNYLPLVADSVAAE